MKILITSGGTSESIDQVRSITNHATGRLGATIAKNCLSAGLTVTLVTTKQAIKPEEHERLTIIEITDVAHLFHTLEELVPTHDALIHSMAVSDYSPVYMTGLEQVKQSSNIEEFLDLSNHEEKISSTEEYQVLFLKKTPKIISYIKQWNPTILLIGFKLLVNASETELLQVARTSLEKNQADYLLANDFTKINTTQHQAYLVSHKGYEVLKTKQEIADCILEKILENRR